MNVVARWPGATHDQTIFRHSLIHDRFEAGEFGRYILVGDSGYRNTFFLATPYTENNPDLRNDAHMQAYQVAIIRTRNVVERQYGVLKRRFPALAYGMRVSIPTAQQLITTACILHNICIDVHEPEPPPMPDWERMIADGEIGNVDDGRIENRRERLARNEILGVFRAR